MAEGGISRSILGGSEDYFTIQCDPCMFGETVSEGVAFCTVCKENLCADCLRVHKKRSVTRDHSLLEGRNLPLSKEHANGPDSDFLCDLHRQPLQKVCPTHNALLCYICITIDHGKCPDLKDFSQVSQEEGRPEEVRQFIDQIESLTDQLKDVRDKETDKRQKISKEKQDCVEKVRALRRDLNTLLDELESRMCLGIDGKGDEEIRLTSTRIGTVGKVIGALQHAKCNVEKVARHGCKQAYIAMMSEAPKLQSAVKALTDIQDSNKTVHISFEPEAKLTDLLSSCDQLGKVTFSRKISPYLRADNDIPGSLRDERMELIGRHSTKVKGDIGCTIRDLIVTKHDNVLVCDWINEKLKLLDNSYAVQSSLLLPGEPAGVAAISDNEVVVTVPKKKMIQFALVDEEQFTLEHKELVETTHKCWAIVYHKDKLYVTCHNQPGNSEVQVLDKKGQLLNRIPETSHFQRPSFMAVDSEGLLYISDRGADTVTCMTTSGHMVFKRQKDETTVRQPRGLVVDTAQNVYIVGELSLFLNILGADGRFYKTTVKATADSISLPISLAYRKTDRTLLIGSNMGDIFCYRFC